MSIQEHIIRRTPLSRFAAAVKQGHATVGILGGSITDPVGRQRWSEYVENQLVADFPDCRFHFENEAIGATGSLSALFRMDRSIVSYDCDLVIVEYAVNDSGDDRDIRMKYREGMLRKLLAAGADVVSVYTFAQGFLDDLLKGEQPESIRDFEELTVHYGISSVFMADWAREQVSKGLVRWEELLPDGLHPANTGSRYYAEPVSLLLREEVLNVSAETEPHVLPAPFREDHWQHAYEGDLESIETTGPWMYRNIQKFQGFDHVLYTSAPGAEAVIDFEGTGLAFTVNFGFLCADFEWSVDGDDFIRAGWERPDWMSDLGWQRTHLLCHDLPKGPHTVRIRTVMDSVSNAKGSLFEICNIGIV